MKVFQQREIKGAVAHAADGGQALHLHRLIRNRQHAPRCFVEAIDRGEDIAHLFDRDKSRLIRTARSLGVGVIHVDREGDRMQHIDLCSAPLRKALAMCEEGRVEER